ncbi:MAG: hypothetical protein F9K18_00595 [Thermoanaerobaculia bacterium]|nr:MAG: hypothetical protein F9K18_00595 [Thermoanaerobaculia bacterium]
MRRHWLVPFAALLFAAALPAAPPLDFRQYTAPELSIVYLEAGQEYILPHMARCFENSLDFYRELMAYEPSEPVTILLQDFDDYGYAGATAMPLNYLTLGIEPFEYVYETSPTNERINWVMSHELLHVVAADAAAPSDRRFRRLFAGKVGATAEQPLSILYSYLTTPRLYAPRWYHEGMAVFFETWMAGGYGRALGGYDEMVFRTMVAEGAPFWDTVGLESEGKAIDFQSGQLSYLYGTRFVSYLAYRHGPEKVLAWLARGEGSRASFRAQFRQVFGNDLDGEWRRWIEWEKEWQEANLAGVRSYPVTGFRALSERPLGSVSRAFWDEERRTLYTAVNYPGEFAHIVAIEIDRWQVRKIAEIPTPALYYVASLAYDAASRTVFFTTHNSRQWRDLEAVSVDSGEVTPLIENTRVGDLAFNRGDGSLWGVRHHNGVSTLVRIAPPFRHWQDITEVMVLPYGKDLFDIDISPDGRHLTGSIIEVSGRQRLVRMELADLLSGASPYEVLHEFANNSPANFVYSPDGRFLFGTSYYTGVSNVFRYDFESGEMEAVTNGVTGFFRPLPVSDAELVAFHYTARGFVPVMLANLTVEDIRPIRYLGQAIVEKHPVVKEWKLPSPATVDLDALAPATGDYAPAGEMKLTSAYPVLEGYRGTTAFGLRLNFMDPVGFASLDLTASASPDEDLPDDERVHLSARYRYPPWELFGHFNRADFYDFFGPTEVSRKGWAVGVGYSDVLRNDAPERLDYALRATRFGDLDTLPENQNVPIEVPDYTALSARLSYRLHRKTIGGLDPEKGLEWTLAAADRFVGSDQYPRAWATLGFGVPLAWDHSSLWPQLAAGIADGAADDPLANFYFGAFGNNWVDHGEVRRFREPWAFPGLEIDELPGRTFGELVLEWRLPPLRFRRLGVPEFYVTWASASLFGGGLVSEIGRDLQQEAWDLGAQVDFRVVLFTNLSATLSFGYARAWREGLPSSDEFMASLKIM